MGDTREFGSLLTVEVDIDPCNRRVYSFCVDADWSNRVTLRLREYHIQHRYSKRHKWMTERKYDATRSGNPYGRDLTLKDVPWNETLKEMALKTLLERVLFPHEAEVQP